jgi:hypothetical protein
MHARKGLVESSHKKIMWYFYEFKKLKEHERSYATHDIELASFVHTLKMWKNYLMERKFELRIITMV